MAVAARSTSAASVIAYSVMRTRSASFRKSGRISGQGSRLGCVDFLLTLAHAARKNRARHTVVRMKLAHHRGPELLIRRILVADIDPLANRIEVHCCWHPAVRLTA